MDRWNAAWEQVANGYRAAFRGHGCTEEQIEELIYMDAVNDCITDEATELVDAEDERVREGYDDCGCSDWQCPCSGSKRRSAASYGVKQYRSPWGQRTSSYSGRI
jgi:hypothetical protein